MKYAHLADCHIGGWREPKMRDANTNAFIQAITNCLNEKVEFVLISGDLFNTAVPGIDALKMAVEQLKKLKDNNIPVYYIAGSHDYSPSGKTMLDILEEAGLATNVAKGTEENGKLKLKFTIDKTGTKITGLIGKKGGLEKDYYHYLDFEHLEQESGHKIFLFHTALTELKPKDLADMDSMPVSLLPKGFNYYAGGHVHVVDRQNVEGRQNIVYPGPIYPNNFSEIEKLRHGSFVIVEDDKIRHVPLIPYPTICIHIDAKHNTPQQITEKLHNEIEKHDYQNAIVTIRITGQLENGKTTDIQWQEIIQKITQKGAHFIMKNTNGLKTNELQTITINDNSVEQLETQLIKEHHTQIKLTNNDEKLIKDIMHAMNSDKQEGEKNADYEQRIITETEKIIG